MAVTVLDTVNNQWFVQRKDGELELCHNAATAKLFAVSTMRKSAKSKRSYCAQRDFNFSLWRAFNNEEDKTKANPQESL